MTGIMTNSALNVKIHGKLKNRLTRDMYIRMTNLKSVPQVAQFLKNETSWGSLLSDIDTENIHRGFLEELLGRGINRDIKELAAFTDISQGAFMKLFSIRCEIENLKVFLRLLYSGHPERFHALADLSGGEIDFSKLSEVKSYEELMGIIDGTIYAVPLRGFLDYNEKQRIFDVESALDIYYNETVFKFAKKYLSREEYDIVRETYGSKADLEAVMFIIRAKKNFDFPKEQMYPYTRHKYAHLNDKIISEMIEAKTLDEVYDIIGRTKYASIFEGNPLSCERKIEEYLQKLHRKMFRHSGYSIEAVLYYVKIREIELRNIVTITEGIRYGLEPTDIQRYIIGARE